MTRLAEVDIVRAKQLLDAHEKLVQEYQERLAADDELVTVERGMLNIRGHEVVSNEVIEPPLGFLDQPDLMETIRRMIRSEEFRRANEGEESFEEADDFDVEDDIDPASPYEMYFDPHPFEPQGPSGQDATGKPANPETGSADGTGGGAGGAKEAPQAEANASA